MLQKKLCNKVLTIGCTYDPPTGGVAQVLYTYSREVYPVFHFVANSNDGSAIAKLWQAMWGLMKMTWMLSIDRNLRIVHIHTASYNSFKRSAWFVRVAKLMRRKVVLHIHGGGFRDYYQTKSEWIIKILKKTDCILALTDNWKMFFSEELNLPKVETIPNIVSNPCILKNEKDTTRLHLLFLGFIVDQKGIFDLVEVIKEHKSDWEGKLLLHVGGSHEVDRLLKYIQENELDNLIRYEGWVAGNKKIAMLNQMDAYILPSYTEGMPVSILEAMSYGKPVITTPVGGIPEVVNESNGFLLTPGNHKEIYEIINQIIENPAILKKKAENTENAVEKYFPGSVTKTMERIYKQLLEE